MLNFWRTKIKKGINYYQENGLWAFVRKCLTLVPPLLRYYYYRMVSLWNTFLNRVGLLKIVSCPDGIPKVIISLTSHPPRIKTIHKVIETLLVQTYKADRIILWLAEEEFPGREADLPKSLCRLTAKGFEIRWCKNIRSYKKLIPTLKLFPDAIIVTVDDDNLYRRCFLERLIEGYMEMPDCIQCHRASAVTYHFFNDFDVNDAWNAGYPFATYLNLQVGCSGCLYPPHCFYPDIMNETLFVKLVPTNDDVWFWLMGILNGYKINIVNKNIALEATVPQTQKSGLWRTNGSVGGQFEKQIKKSLEYYLKAQELLQNEQKRLDNFSDHGPT